MALVHHDLRFGLVCLVLIVVGGWIRLSAGWQPFGLGAEVHAGAGEASPADLSASVLRFYELIDDGHYAAAYQLVLENRWQVSSTGDYSVEGLMSEAEFVATLNREMGSQGLGQNIIKIAVTAVSPYTLTAGIPPDRPELWTLSFLPGSVQVEEVRQVRVAGALLGRCSQWDWDERLLAARVRDGTTSQWRLLLPGLLDDRFPHYQEWFMDRNPLVGRRVTPP